MASLNIFLSHKKDKTSFIDSANLALAQKYNCKIASFDKFYPNNLLLK
jgi:predicted nucleic acid-binding protein